MFAWLFCVASITHGAACEAFQPHSIARIFENSQKLKIIASARTPPANRTRRQNSESESEAEEVSVFLDFADVGGGIIEKEDSADAERESGVFCAFLRWVCGLFAVHLRRLHAADQVQIRRNRVLICALAGGFAV